VGLAVADAVDALLGRFETRLKWPNDVLLGERKLAGILCEGRWHGEALQWLAVGVGVNVCNAIPAPVAHRAVALGEWLPSVRRLDVLDRLVPALAGFASGDPALSERECTAFAARDCCRVASFARPPPAARAASARTARCSSISARRRSPCGKVTSSWRSSIGRPDTHAAAAMLPLMRDCKSQLGAGAS